jgi:polysaccharide pyruvyl transferase WcaK-like protein
MRRVDLLIVAGSNQLSDYFGGPWGFPYSVCAWSAAARLAGAPVAFLSVGAGPIRSPLSGFFIRTALSWSAYHSLRDVGSRDAVQAVGAPGPHPIAPDLAQGLKVPPVSGSRPERGRRTVVVNPLPYFDPRYWAERDAAVYLRYVDLLAAFTRELLSRGYRVRFAPTQLRADPPVIADVVRALGRPSDEAPGERIDPAVATFEDLIALLGEADVVVATRFHGVVLAQLIGRPTIGIAYRRSTTDLLIEVGQGAYVLDIRELTLAGLLARLAAIEADSGAGERVRARMCEFRDALAAQYDLVLGKVARSSRPARPASGG